MLLMSRYFIKWMPPLNRTAIRERHASGDIENARPCEQADQHIIAR